MNTETFFNEIETNQQKQLGNFMKKYNKDINLKPNQRIKKDKYTGIFWVEEKMKWKDPDGQRHNCWVRIGTYNMEK